MLEYLFLAFLFLILIFQFIIVCGFVATIDFLKKIVNALNNMKITHVHHNKDDDDDPSESWKKGKPPY